MKKAIKFCNMSPTSPLSSELLDGLTSVAALALAGSGVSDLTTEINEYHRSYRNK